MDAVFSKHETKLTIEENQKFDDEFELEQSANRFRESFNRKAIVEQKNMSVNVNQDVYFDPKTGKIVVNLKKSDTMTGVKRHLDRNAKDGDFDQEQGVLLKE